MRDIIYIDGDDFPGHDKARMSYNQLEIVLDRGKRDRDKE